MREIEVKILEVNRKDVEAKLLKLGAKKVFEGELNAVMFDFEDEKIKNARDLLRLRKDGKKVILTYKKFVNVSDVKDFKEIEVEVSDFSKMKEILEELGLAVVESTRKTRISYQLEGVHFDFDKYLDENIAIPEFLEIEAEDNIVLHKYVNLLGFERKDCKPLTFFEVREYYKN
ncbi:CYTH domain-containing protein [Candidatus Woesearchaeota archaeon]|nr:CYTH domain-containing protein [Candidatus Woesearchaeota archaeon]